MFRLNIDSYVEYSHPKLHLQPVANSSIQSMEFSIQFMSCLNSCLRSPAKETAISKCLFLSADIIRICGGQLSCMHQGRLKSVHLYDSINQSKQQALKQNKQKNMKSNFNQKANLKHKLKGKRRIRSLRISHKQNLRYDFVIRGQRMNKTRKVKHRRRKDGKLALYQQWKILV